MTGVALFVWHGFLVSRAGSAASVRVRQLASSKATDVRPAIRLRVLSQITHPLGTVRSFSPAVHRLDYTSVISRRTVSVPVALPRRLLDEAGLWNVSKCGGENGRDDSPKA